MDFRMFEAEFRCTFDLLAGIPSLDDPAVSVTQDTYNSHAERGWDDAARLVDHDGRLVNAHSMGFWDTTSARLRTVAAGGGRFEQKVNLAQPGSLLGRASLLGLLGRCRTALCHRAASPDAAAVAAASGVEAACRWHAQLHAVPA